MDFDAACRALAQAKEHEARAHEARLEAEANVLAMMRHVPEGSVTERGTQWKATATYGVNRTLDAAALESIRASMPAALFEQAITYKPAIVLVGLRYLKANEPETYTQLAAAITARPAKPSVRIEPLES